jgi:hypothetical protein
LPKPYNRHSRRVRSPERQVAIARLVRSCQWDGNRLSSQPKKTKSCDKFYSVNLLIGGGVHETCDDIVALPNHFRPILRRSRLEGPSFRRIRQNTAPVELCACSIHQSCLYGRLTLGVPIVQKEGQAAKTAVSTCFFCSQERSVQCNMSIIIQIGRITNGAEI